MQKTEQSLHDQQENVYKLYNERLRWVISFIESKFKRFPVPLLNEIRAAQDHISRCYDKSIPGYNEPKYIKRQMNAAKNHYLRCLLDGYKYIWFHFGAQITRKYFWAKLLGNLSDINNGDFIETLTGLNKAAKKFNWEARMSESTNKSKAIDFYEKAIHCLIDIDDLYEDNIKAISWSIRKGMVLKALAALGWIISLLLTIIQYWDSITNFFS